MEDLEWVERASLVAAHERGEEVCPPWQEGQWPLRACIDADGNDCECDNAECWRRYERNA